MLKQHLNENRTAILEGWFARVVASYPEETGKLLRRRHDPFSNPVGASLRQCLDGILDFLAEGGDRDELSRRVEQFIKIRSVQEFTPAAAMAFVFLLKSEIRDELDDRLGDPALVRELLDFESTVDGVALICFEHYSQTREQLHQIAAASNYRQTHVLVERLNRMSAERRALRGDAPDEEPPADDPEIDHEM